MNGVDIAAAVARIRAYLAEYPNAADTLEGVAVWWLAGNTSEEYLITVQCAIRELVVAGEMSKHVLIDGTIIYERAGPS